MEGEFRTLVSTLDYAKKICAKVLEARCASSKGERAAGMFTRMCGSLLKRDG